MNEDLRQLLGSLDTMEITRLAHCFRLAEQVLGPPEEYQDAFAELLVRLYSADRSVEIGPRPQTLRAQLAR